jgi:hypothetical protein
MYTPAFVWTGLAMFWSGSVRKRGDGYSFLIKNPGGFEPSETLAIITKPLPDPRVAFSSRFSVREAHHFESPW